LKEMNAVTEGGTEMRNAVYYMAATEELGAFDFGLFHWNTLVFTFFPRQIFGMSAKANLMSLGGLLQIGRNAERAYGYEGSYGTTNGGISDAFASFWYFGCFEFFVMAYCIRRVYESAARGPPVWQLAYALMIYSCLLAITHSTNCAVVPWVQGALFLGPALIYARVRPGEGKREVISSMQIIDQGRSPVGAGCPAHHRSGGSLMDNRAVAEGRRFNIHRLRYVRFISIMPKRRLSDRGGMSSRGP
jgi:hypothetical protein